MKYQYEFFLPQNPKPKYIDTITGDLYDAEKKADEIAAKLGIDEEDLIIAVTVYEEVGHNDRS